MSSPWSAGLDASDDGMLAWSRSNYDVFRAECIVTTTQIGLPQYATLFVDHNIGGYVLKQIQLSELRLIGVDKLAHRKYICNEADSIGALDGIEQELSAWAVTRTSRYSNHAGDKGINTVTKNTYSLECSALRRDRHASPRR